MRSWRERFAFKTRGLVAAKGLFSCYAVARETQPFVPATQSTFLAHAGVEPAVRANHLALHDLVSLVERARAIPRTRLISCSVPLNT